MVYNDSTKRITNPPLNEFTFVEMLNMADVTSSLKRSGVLSPSFSVPRINNNDTWAFTPLLASILRFKPEKVSNNSSDEVATFNPCT